MRILGELQDLDKLPNLQIITSRVGLLDSEAWEANLLKA